MLIIYNPAAEELPAPPSVPLEEGGEDGDEQPAVARRSASAVAVAVACALGTPVIDEAPAPIALADAAGSHIQVVASDPLILLHGAAEELPRVGLEEVGDDASPIVRWLPVAELPGADDDLPAQPPPPLEDDPPDTTRPSVIWIALVPAESTEELPPVAAPPDEPEQPEPWVIRPSALRSPSSDPDIVPAAVALSDAAGSMVQVVGSDPLIVHQPSGEEVPPQAAATIVDGAPSEDPVVFIEGGASILITLGGDELGSEAVDDAPAPTLPLRRAAVCRVAEAASEELVAQAPTVAADDPSEQRIRRSSAPVLLGGDVVEELAPPGARDDAPGISQPWARAAQVQPSEQAPEDLPVTPTAAIDDEPGEPPLLLLPRPFILPVFAVDEIPLRIDVFQSVKARLRNWYVKAERTWAVEASRTWAVKSQPRP